MKIAVAKLEALSRFPKVFWVVQSFELLERGVYYTMIPILAVHALFNVGLPVWLAAIITSFMYPIQYGLPILSGALAEKIGYRRQIIFAFFILSAAYMLLAFAFNSITMIIAVMCVGFGIGSYKPLISSTVAKSTTEEDRNLAFGVYYWIVNLGAFVFPLIYVILEFAGIITQSTYYIVFWVGAIVVSINIFTAFFVFKEVPRSGDVKTVKDALINIKIALADKKFMVMVFLIGGFWALYSTMLNVLPLILFGFKLVPTWFSAMLLGVFNPLTIITFGIPLSKFIEKIEPMKVMMSGVMIYILGITIIGFSLLWMWVIIGIIIAAIGEFMVAPGYLSFISKLAPKEKVSAYIGANFLAMMLGLAGGTFVFSLLATNVAVNHNMPHFFYGILISFGLLILFGLMIYNKSWGAEIIERARKIKELEEGIDAGSETFLTNKEPFIFHIFNFRFINIVPLIFIPIVLVITFSMGTYHFYGTDDIISLEQFSLEDYSSAEGYFERFSGTLEEGHTAIISIPIEIEERNLLKSITFELIWEDEEDYRQGLRTWENQPDEFYFTASLCNNLTLTDSASNAHGSEQRIILTREFHPNSVDYCKGAGDWIVEVTLVRCGEFENPSSSPIYIDNSNTYEMFIRLVAE